MEWTKKGDRSSMPVASTQVVELQQQALKLEGNTEASELLGRLAVLQLKDEINQSTRGAMRVDKGLPMIRDKGKKGLGAGGTSTASCVDSNDYACSSSSLPMKEEEKLKRLVKELAGDVQQDDPDIDFITSKMKRISTMWTEVMMDIMRDAITDFNGNAVDTLDPEELNEKMMIEAMDGEALKYFSIADYKKKPEQPKGCSRAIWMEHLKFYNCLLCNTVELNVKQFLAHFACGNHWNKAIEIVTAEGPTKSYGFATKFIINLTKLCDESGAKSLQPSNESIPSLDFLDKIEHKYGNKINGDFDSARLNDPVYVASLLPDIVKKHKSVLGKKLFKELHEYLGTGKSFYCRRCHWKVSNRESFYRHMLNPYHVNMTYLEDGRQFNLLTLSINLHMRDEN